MDDFPVYPNEPFSNNLQPSPPAAIGKPFDARAWPYIFDFVVCNGIAYFIGYFSNQLHALVLTPAAALFRVGYTIGDLDRVTATVVGFGMMVVYFSVFEWLFGATPGKWIFRMRVIRADGRACGLGPAVVRAVMRLPDSLFFGMPAYLSMKYPLRQRLGDKLAKTMVVGRADGYIRQPRPLWRGLLASWVYVLLLVPLGLVLAVTYIDRAGPFVGNAALDINVQNADLGSEFRQSDEDRSDYFTATGVLDGNQRWFTSRSLRVYSKVVAVDHFPGDTLDSLKTYLDKDTRAEFKETTLDAKQVKPLVGADLGWVMEYGEKETGKDVVCLVFIQQNVFVQVFLYGTPTAAEIETAENLAKIMLERIRSGYRAPSEGGANS